MENKTITFYPANYFNGNDRFQIVTKKHIKYEYKCPFCGDWLSEDFLIGKEEMPFYCCEDVYDVPICNIKKLKKRKKHGKN